MDAPDDGRPGRAERLLLVGLPLLLIALQLAASRGWDYFRDELYYLACADRLAWGYVDHPPLSIAILAGWRALFGSSLISLHLLGALPGAALLVLTGLLVRRMGGRAPAMALAMLALIATPAVMAVTGFYSMNAFEPVFWMAAGLLLLTILDRPSTGGWLGFGVLIGLGLLNKYSMIWFVGGAGVGLLLTPHRRRLRTRGPWLAAAVAAALFAPHLAWEAANGWPTREFMRNATGDKMAPVSFATFWSQQFLVHNPFLAPLWLGGLFWLFVNRRGRQFRVFGWLFLAVTALLIVNGRSRPNYLTPAYPFLAAAGATALDSLRGRRRMVIGPAIAVTVAAGALLMPLAIPILSIDATARHLQRLGIVPYNPERASLGRLPQHLADRTSWQALVGEVARAWSTLTSEDRARARIYTSNYGEAGAIQLFGPRYGLPPPISGHNNYWLWGPGDWTGEVLIVYGDSREDAESSFSEVTEIGRVRCADCMPFEDDNPIWLCRGPKFTVRELWPRTREFE